MLEMWVLLLSSVISGAIGHAIGQRKGRATAGFLFGLLIGPLGWALIALGPSFAPKCAMCKGPVPADACRCMHCGSILGAAVAA